METKHGLNKRYTPVRVKYYFYKFSSKVYGTATCMPILCACLISLIHFVVYCSSGSTFSRVAVLAMTFISMYRFSSSWSSIFLLRQIIQQLRQATTITTITTNSKPPITDPTILARLVVGSPTEGVLTAVVSSLY